MSAGASGGADIEGRAFDAGPTAQNESAASIGEAAGLSGQAARDYGIAQMDALDAQHGTNFGQRARGLTGNNSIGTAELDSFGFDADAPSGLQHAQQRTAFEQGLFDPSTMMAQNALQSLSWDFMKNPLGIINQDELGIAHPHTFTGYSPKVGYFKYAPQDDYYDTGLLGLAKTMQAGMRGRPLYGPNATPVAVHGYDPGLGPHYEGPVREVDFRNDFGSTSSGVLSQDGYESLFDGVDVQALDDAILGLDNAFASTDNNFGNYSGISPSFDTGSLSRAGGDPRLAEAQRLAAQLLAQQAAASVIGDIDFTPDEVKIINTPPANTTPGTTPPGTTTPPPGTTTPPDDSVADDPSRGNRPNPIVKKRKAIRKKIATATKAKLNPKGLKKLPKFVQNSLRQGKIPDGMKSYHSDMVTAFLAPPEPVWQPGSRTRPPGSGR